MSDSTLMLVVFGAPLLVVMTACVTVLLTTRKRKTTPFPQELPHNCGEAWIIREMPVKLSRAIDDAMPALVELDPMPVRLDPDDMTPDNAPCTRAEKERALERHQPGDMLPKSLADWTGNDAGEKT